jgi:signal transduction histidine kinase/ActR/RegA family two-component response regulator
MSSVTAEVLYRSANAVLGVVALIVAALIVGALTRRKARTQEPLGVAFAAVFLAIGVGGIARAVYLEFETLPVVIAVDWIAVLAVAGIALCWRSYDLFIESVDKGREYETEVAEKNRETRALTQLNEELRRLDELKSEFLAMVSHELRTPLTAIIGYSRLLTRQIHGTLTPKQLEHHDAIFRSAQRLTSLINDLLDVSRLEAGRVELQPRPTEAKQVIDQVISVVGVAAHAKQISITNSLPAELPMVSADPSRLQQILVNLLGNAVKFTPSGGTVRVRGGVTDDKVWVAVEDTGVGIPDAQLAQIWNAFYQVESPLRRTHGGSGLGLSIVRRLVELHGGAVRAESAGENRGSRFTFTLPVAAVQPAPEVVAEASGAIEPILAGRRVLVIEDEKENQALLRDVVEDMLGGIVVICDEGESGFVAAVEHRPALILLDLMLPGLSGWEVARRLRSNAQTRGIPIVAVSALARPQERDTALRAGCDAYITKPFSPEEMARVIGTVLARERVTAR